MLPKSELLTSKSSVDKLRNAPFENYSDVDFRLRYRFNKENVHKLVTILCEKLKNSTNPHNSLSPETKVSDKKISRSVASRGHYRSSKIGHPI
uniref:Uncharacterized protein n=1 Tax=Romanomermis culicivorax TaxID=13658 RepID=A0A915K121_ROMCU